MRTALVADFVSIVRRRTRSATGLLRGRAIPPMCLQALRRSEVAMDGPAKARRSLEFFSKICVLSSIGCPSGRGWGRQRPDSMGPRGSRSHEVPVFFESVIVPSQLAAVSMPTVGVADPGLRLENAVPREAPKNLDIHGGT